MHRAPVVLALALASVPCADPDEKDRHAEGHRHASKMPNGPEFRVNTFTTGNQGDPSVAFHNPSGAIVVWQSDGQDGSGAGVFGKITFSGSGTEFRVNTATTGDQRDPSVASNGSGDFVVAWTSPQDGSGDGIFAQRFASSGAPLGPEFQVNSYTTGTQYQAVTASDLSGNFVVVWSSVGQEGAGAEVFGQRYSASGVPLGPEFRVNTYTTGYQHRPAVGAMADGSGSFTVVWQDGAAPGGPGGAGRGIFGQRFDNSGAPVGTEFQVNTYTTGFHGAPAITPAASTGFVVVRHSDGQDGSDLGIFGDRNGSEFQVNSYTTGRQAYPAVAHEFGGIGCFLVVWSSDGEDGSGPGVFSQVYLGGVTPLGVFRVNEFTTGSQARPSVAPVDTEFDHIVVWDSEGQDGSGTGIYGRMDVHFVPVELMQSGVE
jgi:hypothetical protein